MALKIRRVVYINFIQSQRQTIIIPTTRCPTVRMRDTILRSSSDRRAGEISAYALTLMQLNDLCYYF